MPERADLRFFAAERMSVRHADESRRGEHQTPAAAARSPSRSPGGDAGPPPSVAGESAAQQGAPGTGDDAGELQLGRLAPR